MVLALSIAPACGDDGSVTTETDGDSTGTTDDPTTLSTSSPSTTVNPSTTGMTMTTTGETDTESTTGDTDPTTGDTETTTGEPTTTGETETTTTGDLCGNGMVDAGEDCDGADLDGETCMTQGADEGDLACTDECMFDVTGCIMYSCGNDMQEGSEVCDGTDLADQTCEGLDFDGGTLACAAGCMAFDTSGCFGCGNGVIDGDDVCDGAAVGAETCESQGFLGGTLGCASDCSGYDTTTCSNTLCSSPGLAIGPGAGVLTVDSITVGTTGAFVGDVNVSVTASHSFAADMEIAIRHVDTDTSVRLVEDQCSLDDDIDATFDQEGAALVCSMVPPAIAGTILPLGNLDNFDGLTDAAGTWELSINDDASGDGGTLTEWCITIAPAETNPAMCGDSSAQFGEICDGADLRGATCITEDFDSGTLGCLDDCSGYDTTGCFACGDGTMNGDEACDGADLGGADCASQGFPAGGTLACNTDCTFDISACTGPQCGDSVVEAPEECDTNELAGTTCADLGYVGGALDCSSCGFDEAECSNSIIAMCSTPDLAIVDNMSVVDTITLMDMGTIADIDVFVDITHTFGGDLDISLRDGAGTLVDLTSDQCAGDNDVFATFNDEGTGLPDCIEPVGIEGNVTPEGLLSTFDGVAISGAWDLVVGDDAAGDSGTLNEWCIYITPL